MLNDQGLKTDIQVDGGVNAGNVREIIEAGANIFVAGSAVFGNGSPRRRYIGGLRGQPPHIGTETRTKLLREAAVRNIGQWTQV